MPCKVMALKYKFLLAHPKNCQDRVGLEIHPTLWVLLAGVRLKAVEPPQLWVGLFWLRFQLPQPASQQFLAQHEQLYLHPWLIQRSCLRLGVQGVRRETQIRSAQFLVMPWLHDIMSHSLISHKCWDTTISQQLHGFLPFFLLIKLV